MISAKTQATKIWQSSFIQLVMYKPWQAVALNLCVLQNLISCLHYAGKFSASYT
jgi:hypothetical protein